MVNEQDSVQMVDLMLDAGCQDPVGLQCANLVFPIQIAKADFIWPNHIGLMFGYAAAAFLMLIIVIRNPDKSGIR